MKKKTKRTCRRAITIRVFPLWTAMVLMVVVLDIAADTEELSPFSVGRWALVSIFSLVYALNFFWHDRKFIFFENRIIFISPSKPDDRTWRKPRNTLLAASISCRRRSGPAGRLQEMWSSSSRSGHQNRRPNKTGSPDFALSPITIERTEFHCFMEIQFLF